MKCISRYRSNSHVCWGVVVFLGCLFAACNPLKIQVSRCEPEAIDNSVVDPVFGRAWGNDTSLRQTAIRFSYTVPAGATEQDKLDAIEDTKWVEVCWTMQGLGQQCPWTDSGDTDWLVYHVNDKPDTKPTLAQVETTGNATTTAEHWLPIDWKNHWNAGRVLFIRINGTEAITAEEAEQIATDDGFCPLAYPLGFSENNHFSLYGTTNLVPNPFTALDVCADGNKTNIGYPNACLHPDFAPFILEHFPKIEQWQRQAVLGGLGDVFAWAQGSGGDCEGPNGICGTKLIIDLETVGGSLEGRVWLKFTEFQYTNAFNTHPEPHLSQAITFPLAVMGHEFFHTFHRTWDRHKTAPQANDYEGFSEPAARAVGFDYCIFDYEDVPNNVCTSASRIGHHYLRVDGLNLFLSDPAMNMFEYSTAFSEIFWWYAMEQYAVPVDSFRLKNPAHPSGTQSGIPADLSLPIGHEDRRTDEGVDLFRHILQRFTDQPTESIPDAIDYTVTTHIGRDFDGMMHDLHTAYVLKDYTAAHDPQDDARWHLEWVGNFNAGATNTYFPESPPGPTIADIKAAQLPPFEGMLKVPSNINIGEDKLRRAHRLLDSYDVSTYPPTPLTLTYGDHEEGAGQLMQPNSMVVLSVHPDNVSTSSWAINIQVIPRFDNIPIPIGGAIRMRVFTIDMLGNPSLLQSCQLMPDGPPPAATDTCKPKIWENTGGTYSVGYNETVYSSGPQTNQIKEIIVVISKDSHMWGMFDWRIGYESTYLPSNNPSSLLDNTALSASMH